MDIKQIQELIKFVSRSGVNEVSIEQKEFKITIKTNQPPTYINAALPAVQPQAAVTPAALPLTDAKTASPASIADETINFLAIKSPMIGTFYRSSSPDKAFFVNVGDEVKTGQVVCIIEAMKLFNEIESEISGRIVKILVENSSPVEYDQPLFIVESI